MEEFSWIRDLSYGTAVALFAALLLYIVYGNKKKLMEHRRNHEKYVETLSGWKSALEEGDTGKAMQFKRELDRMAKLGWDVVKAIAVVSALSICGCKSTSVVSIPVGEHILHPNPGDTVPAFPPGEKKWWLCTPTGLTLLLPEDSPILSDKGK